MRTMKRVITVLALVAASLFAVAGGPNPAEAAKPTCAFANPDLHTGHGCVQFYNTYQGTYKVSVQDFSGTSTGCMRVTLRYGSTWTWNTVTACYWGSATKSTTVPQSNGAPNLGRMCYEDFVFGNYACAYFTPTP